MTFEDWSVTRIEFEENYRSTQAILDFSERGLLVPATGSDDVDVEAVRDEIVSLDSNSEHENTRIEAIKHAEEHEALLTKLQQIAGNEDYAVEDEDGGLRPPTLGDVAVLTRTKDFGRDLLQAAKAFDIPMAYEGGIELFRTDQAKLVLAWLRILEADVDRGWAVVLERAGYTLDEIAHILDTEDTESSPEDMRAFKAELETLESVGALAEQVLARYGYDGTYADVVIETVQDTFDATTMTRGDLVRFIERGIDEGATHDVSAPAGTDAVTVQTIHAAKGLEYPIVVLANMNRHKFPSTGGDSAVVTFDDPIGLRQREVFDDDNDYPHVYDNWRADVLRKCLPNEYDEERRLLYVAMTRAKSHLVFSAGEEPNTFLDELPVEVETLEPDVEEAGPGETVQATLDVSVPLPEGPVGWNPHDLMSEEVFAETPEGRGTEFGTQVHEFAEAYANGEDVEPGGDEPDWENVTEFIDGLNGKLFVEQEARLPLEVNGQTITISGVLDLVHEYDDRVHLIDYKTDRSKLAEEEYQKQLSVYYHVLDAWFQDHTVGASIYYTYEDIFAPIDPLTKDELRRLLRTRQQTVEGALND